MIYFMKNEIIKGFLCQFIEYKCYDYYRKI